ncbi:MAG: type IV secretion system protein [Rickettsiales bacterium]|jgi:type IV secretory pathway component VirB8|nr:type IV secretion system protein [Rickettsiales bacterium]
MKQIDELHYLWVMRALCVVAAFGLAVMTTLLFTMRKVAPGQKLSPFVITANTGSAKSFLVRPMPKTTQAIEETVAKAAIAKYIIDRESLYLDRRYNKGFIDGKSDVAAFSSPEEYERYRNSADYAARIANAERRIATVEVKPEDIRYMQKLGYYEVIYTRTTMDSKGLDRKSSRLMVNVKAGFARGGVVKPAGEMLWRNPLGFYITSYEKVSK